MIRIVDQNAEAFLADLDEITGADLQGDQFLSELGNAMDYAVHLHNTEGYDVLNDEAWTQAVHLFLRELIAGTGSGPGKPLTERVVMATLERANAETVAYLQSFTADFQPPVRSGEGPRPAHPGGWADRTKRLASAFYSVVTAPSGASRRTDHPYPAEAGAFV